jgi:hypothetical protein
MRYAHRNPPRTLTFFKARSASSSFNDPHPVLIPDGLKPKKIKPRAITWDSSRQNLQNFGETSSPHHQAVGAVGAESASMLREPG